MKNKITIRSDIPIESSSDLFELFSCSFPVEIYGNIDNWDALDEIMLDSVIYDNVSLVIDLSNHNINTSLSEKIKAFIFSYDDEVQLNIVIID